ncbi:hypothetical protein H4217_008463 [Coemansia sp. RSA 1939]|nr:hypothetical protein H4217_008463 [Coemansia sp. RSA 1939]
MAPSTASVGGSSTVGYVPSGQRIQRPLVQMQYLSSPQLPNQQRQQHQHQHQQMFTPVSSVMHQSHQPPNSSPVAYHQTPSSGTQQPMMQTGSPLMKDSGHQGPGQPFLGMTSMMQPQQNTVTPPNDLRFNNRFSSSFGTSPAVANSSTPSSTSIPALPPKPDELKPYAHKASGSPTSHKPQPAATPSVPSTGPARPQFKYGYGPIVPPPLPKRQNDTQGQQPPALPPKPFASFSEFDYTTDGPGALGSGSQTEHVEQLNTLLSMGFSRPHAIHALEMHDYDVNMASNYLIDKSSS